MLLIDTIEEDTVVPDLEDGSSDEETEQVTKETTKKKTIEKIKSLSKKKKKKSEFSSDFKWDEVDRSMADVEETFDNVIRNSSKGKMRLQENTTAKLATLSQEIDIQESSDEEELEIKKSEDTEINESRSEEQAVNIEKSKFFTEAPEQDLTIKFSEMNLSRPILKGVAALGFAHPTPIQASAIPLALLGKDLCACAVTGSGKTAAYVLPVLERLLYKPKNGNLSRVLVLVPTRELGIQVGQIKPLLIRS